MKMKMYSVIFSKNYSVRFFLHLIQQNQQQFPIVL